MVKILYFNLSVTKGLFSNTNIFSILMIWSIKTMFTFLKLLYVVYTYTGMMIDKQTDRW